MSYSGHQYEKKMQINNLLVHLLFVLYTIMWVNHLIRLRALILLSVFVVHFMLD